MWNLIGMMAHVISQTMLSRVRWVEFKVVCMHGHRGCGESGDTANAEAHSTSKFLLSKLFDAF